jgi:pilus assembly protein CpaF
MADPRPDFPLHSRPFLGDLIAATEKHSHLVPTMQQPPSSPDSNGPGFTPQYSTPEVSTAHGATQLLFAAVTGTPSPTEQQPVVDTPTHDAPASIGPTVHRTVRETEASDIEATYPRPHLVPVLDRPGDDHVDWGVVETLVRNLNLEPAGERTRADFDVAVASAEPETPFEQETLTEIRRLVHRHSDYHALNRGSDFQWSAPLTARYVQAVFDSAFRYGRFQQYLREDNIEDISVVGHNNVMITTTTGLRQNRPPIAGNDRELERMVADLVSWRGRAFGRPNGHIDLDIGGARFSATGAAITSVPNVTLRKHNHVDVTLDDLVDLGTITAPMAEFLTIASHANLSALIAGYPQSGKTTFLRAWMAAVPWEEKIVTIETERELYLGKLTHRHSQVSDFQYVPSTLAGSDLASSYSLEDAFRESLRSSAQRILFGEIRGAEGPVALKAMQAGKGSISTIHARNATDALHRFADILMSEQGLTSDLVPLRQILRSIDLVIYLDMIPGPGGTRRRIVTEIAEVIARPTEQLPMASPLIRWDHTLATYTLPEKLSTDLTHRLARHGVTGNPLEGAEP